MLQVPVLVDHDSNHQSSSRSTDTDHLSTFSTSSYDRREASSPLARPRCDLALDCLHQPFIVVMAQHTISLLATPMTTGSPCALLMMTIS